MHTLCLPGFMAYETRSRDMHIVLEVHVTTPYQRIPGHATEPWHTMPNHTHTHTRARQTAARDDTAGQTRNEKKPDVRFTVQSCLKMFDPGTHYIDVHTSSRLGKYRPSPPPWEFLGRRGAYVCLATMSLSKAGPGRVVVSKHPQVPTISHTIPYCPTYRATPCLTIPYRTIPYHTIP